MLVNLTLVHLMLVNLMLVNLESIRLYESMVCAPLPENFTGTLRAELKFIRNLDNAAEN